MPMVSETMIEIKNGHVWQSPSKMRAIVQWIDGNQWLLLGAPGQSTDGGTCMVAISDSDGSGKIIYTGEELADSLARNKWQREPDAIITKSRN